MPDWELSNNLVNLIGHLAWPVTLLIMLLLIRRHISAILKALSERIKNPGSDIKIGPDGLFVGAPRVAKSGKTTSGDKIDRAIKADPALRAKLDAWMKTNSPELDVTQLIYSSDDELQKLAIDYFQLK